MSADKLTATQRAWIESATPRVERLARIIASRAKHPVDELRSAGFEGLIQAAQRYDPELGIPFGAFAHQRVRGAMIDAMRSDGRVIRRHARAIKSLEASQALLEHARKGQPPRDALDPRTLQQRVRAAAEIVAQTTAAVVLSRVGPLDPDAVAAGNEDAETLVLRGENARAVREEIAASPDDDRALLEAVYLRGQSMGEYADSIGKNKSTVSRHHAKALSRLAARLRRRLGAL